MKGFVAPATTPCAMLDRRGRPCRKESGYVMTRLDGSAHPLCVRHAVKLQEQVNDRPDLFEPLRFAKIG